MTPVTAHVGHWALNLLYVAPVFFVWAFIAIGNRRAGRTRDEEPTPKDGAAAGADTRRPTGPGES
jgi:hypothetical protein